MKLTMKNAFIINALAVALSGCSSTVTKESCYKNWDEFGEKTALSGQTVRKFNEYKEVCGDLAGEEAKSAYLDGWARGIVKYCTFDNGYKLGLSNTEDERVCPYELRSEFERGYVIGIREFEQTVQRLKRESDKVADDSPGSAPRNIPAN